MDIRNQCQKKRARAISGHENHYQEYQYCYLLSADHINANTTHTHTHTHTHTRARARACTRTFFCLVLVHTPTPERTKQLYYIPSKTNKKKVSPKPHKPAIRYPPNSQYVRLIKKTMALNDRLWGRCNQSTNNSTIAKIGFTHLITREPKTESAQCHSNYPPCEKPISKFTTSKRPRARF
jgi:hypothetical protein